jgi:hypothetical protein
MLSGCRQLLQRQTQSNLGRRSSGVLDLRRGAVKLPSNNHVKTETYSTRGLYPYEGAVTAGDCCLEAY